MKNICSFIIPVFNEKENILLTIREIYKYFDEKKIEILFVDDNSPDGSAKEIEKHSKHYKSVKLIQHGKKDGIGAALQFGCKYAKGEYLIFLDADLSQSPKYLYGMISLLDDKTHMVIGSRYLNKSNILNQSMFRKYGSRLFNIFLQIVFILRIRDTTHSFRVFKREIFEKTKNQISEKGHPSFLIQFTLMAIKNNFQIKEYPITFIERDLTQGVSKLSVTKELFRSLIFILRYKFK